DTLKESFRPYAQFSLLPDPCFNFCINVYSYSYDSYYTTAMWGVLSRGVLCYNLVKQKVRRRDMAVRLRVKEVAKEKGISMGKLHRQADVSYKTIKRIYSDPFYATTTVTLGKLAKVLGVPPGDLIEEVPDDVGG